MMKIALLFFVAATAAYALTRAVGKIPADCDPIAEQMTSWELGNYAEPEARAPAVEKYRAMCKDAGIGLDEAECLDEATSKNAAAKCAPRLFPEIEVGDCDGTSCWVDKMRAAADRLCACSSTDCTTRVMEAYAKDAAAMAKEGARNPAPQPTAEEMQLITDLGQQMSTCMVRVASASGSGAGATAVAD
ncbi:MAG: hypothetical protein KF773_01885 [Deltaproteobacteria bacterium]|nr:hypothetical protein [Deltaproteobacteria bacterium]